MALTRRAFAALLALAACATPARPPDLASLAPLLGCWRGEFEGAAEVYDERCFEPLGAHFVDTHYVRPTPYSGETTYHYDEAAREIVFAYAASDGGRSNGSVRAQGGALIFPPHTYIAPDGAPQRLRSTWRFDGADRFVTVSEREEGGVWRTLMRITYTRAPSGL